MEPIGPIGLWRKGFADHFERIIQGSVNKSNGRPTRLYTAEKVGRTDISERSTRRRTTAYQAGRLLQGVHCRNQSTSYYSVVQTRTPTHTDASTHVLRLPSISLSDPLPHPLRHVTAERRSALVTRGRTKSKTRAERRTYDGLFAL